MKSLHKHLLTAGLLATMGLAAVAQTAPSGPAGAPQTYAHRGGAHADPASWNEMRQLRAERRLAAIKLKLQISGSQEGAFNTWAAAMKPPVRQRMDRTEFERLTTPERIDRMRARRANRMAEMDQRGNATKTFYAALNADQRKVFDGMNFGQGKRGGMRGGHHQRHHG